MKRLKFVLEVCGEFGARQVPGDVVEVQNDATAKFLCDTGSAVETRDPVGRADDPVDDGDGASQEIAE